MNLFTIDYVGFFITICTILVGIKAVSALFEWFIEKTGLEIRYFRKQKEEHELLIKTVKGLTLLQERHEDDVRESKKHDKRIEDNLNHFMSDVKRTVVEIQDNVTEIQNNMKQYSENRLNDREISRKIQKNWIDMQEKNTEKIDNILNKINKMKEDTDRRFAENEKHIKENEERNNSRIKAEIKDRVAQAYRFHKKRGKITEMDFEALMSLIKSYEALPQGNNSFIHDIVIKEAYQWERVENDYNFDE